MSIRIEGEPRRSGKIYCVEAEDYATNMVKFCPWKGKQWTLPWSRFEAGSFTHQDESERYELFFPHHHVTVIGENLEPMMKDIRNYHVRCLRDLPESHRSSLGPDEPFIRWLEVRLLGEHKRRPDEVGLF